MNMPMTAPSLAAGNAPSAYPSPQTMPELVGAQGPGAAEAMPQQSPVVSAIRTIAQVITNRKTANLPGADQQISALTGLMKSMIQTPAGATGPSMAPVPAPAAPGLPPKPPAAPVMGPPSPNTNQGAAETVKNMGILPAARQAAENPMESMTQTRPYGQRKNIKPYGQGTPIEKQPVIL
jgi:hypothetical protein